VNGHAGKKANADFIVSTSPVWNALPDRSATMCIARIAHACLIARCNTDRRHLRTRLGVASPGSKTLT
jgi:hypothetical protein